MDVPGIVFLLTGAVAAYVFVKGSLPYFRARTRLERALQELGLKSFVRDRSLSWRMLANRAAIFRESDTPEIRVLKQGIVDELSTMNSVLRRAILIIIIGIGFSIILAAMFD